MNVMQKYRSHADATVIVWAREVAGGYETLRDGRPAKPLGVIPKDVFEKAYRLTEPDTEPERTSDE